MMQAYQIQNNLMNGKPIKQSPNIDGNLLSYVKYRHNNYGTVCSSIYFQKLKLILKIFFGFIGSLMTYLQILKN